MGKHGRLQQFAKLPGGLNRHEGSNPLLSVLIGSVAESGLMHYLGKIADVKSPTGSNPVASVYE